VHHGLVPATDVLRLLGAELAYRPDLGGWVPRRGPALETSVPGVFAAGDCAGIGGAGMSLAEGEMAGVAAAGHALGTPRPPRPAGESSALTRERRFQRLYGALFGPRPGLAAYARPDTVVCRCEEVPRGAVEAAIAAGARTAPLVKSRTRCGMGPCQGRMCLPAVEQLTAAATGLAPVPPTGRAPLVPIPFEAARRFPPEAAR
jgi:NAD(P)H-nitrite reductase large subunit